AVRRKHASCNAASCSADLNTINPVGVNGNHALALIALDLDDVVVTNADEFVAKTPDRFSLGLCFWLHPLTVCRYQCFLASVLSYRNCGLISVQQKAAPAGRGHAGAANLGAKAAGTLGLVSWPVPENFETTLATAL